MTSETSTLEVAGSQIADQFNRRPMMLWGGVAALVVISAGVYVLTSKQTLVDQEAKAALFQAELAYADELKPLLPPEEKPDPTAKKNSKEKAEPKKPQANPQYKKLDVDATFPKAIRAYTDVTEKFKGKPAAFEAMIAVGDLYFDHGQFEKAQPWFEKAEAGAHSAIEKFTVGYARAMTFENVGKADEAIAIYEKLKGDESQMQQAQLAHARLWLKKDASKGKTLLTELEKKDPNSEIAKQARIYRLLAE